MSKRQPVQVDNSQGVEISIPPRRVYVTDNVGWEAMNMIFFLDTSLLQISYLGKDTVNRWHFVLESGRWGRSRRSLVWCHCHPSFLPFTPSSLSQLLPPSFRLSAVWDFFFGFLGGKGGGGSWPSSLSPYKPFLIFLSVINLYLTDSILLYPAHIFFHLPPCLSPSSIALSHRMLKSQWTGYKNMNSTSEKESVILSSFRPAGLVLIFQEAVFFIRLLLNILISATSCSHTCELQKSKSHRAVKTCVMFFEV